VTKRVELKAGRGATQSRTGEWGFCRALPYHLAMAPNMCLYEGASTLRRQLCNKRKNYESQAEFVPFFVREKALSTLLVVSGVERL
jgi:hypothetical protein